MKDLYKEALSSHLTVIQDITQDPTLADLVEEASGAAVNSLKNGGKLLLCGNGGSAADSQHIAAELVGRFGADRRPLPAIALTVDTSAITAIGNDYAFDLIYSRQVEGLGRKGDLLIGISTSGNSPNVLKAIEMAKEMGIVTVGLIGGNRNSAIAAAADICISVPSTATPRVQEAHILIGHIICRQIEKGLLGI